MVFNSELFSMLELNMQAAVGQPLQALPSPARESSRSLLVFKTQPVEIRDIRATCRAEVIAFFIHQKETKTTKDLALDMVERSLCWLAYPLE